MNNRSRLSPLRFLFSLLITQILITGLDAQSCDASSLRLSQTQIEYIYSKATDILLKDRRINAEIEDFPFNLPIIHFDSIHFLIREELVLPIKTWGEDTFQLEKAVPLNVELDTKSIQLVGFNSCKTIAFDTARTYNDIYHSFNRESNTAFIQFSDLYCKSGYIYLRSEITYFIEKMPPVYYAQCTFQINLCGGKVPIFNLGFFPIGLFDDGVHTAILDLYGNPCR